MNVLFLTFGKIESLERRSIYCDLLREFIKNGHPISTLSPGNKGKEKTNYYGIDCSLAYIDLDTVRGGNNYIKKGVTILRTGKQFVKGIKRFYDTAKFDLVIYTTPPITFVSAITYIKKRDGAKTYLLLKDIFPQNAVDIGMMSKSGIKSLLYKYFRRQEKKLYAISDFIGCMSQTNVDYVLKHNPEVDLNKVEVCPNSIEVVDKSVDEVTRKAIRSKYGIPLDKKIFIYGGNLGKPQGIPFVIECLKRCESIEDGYFLIVGDGSEYGKLEEYYNSANQVNLKLMQRLPKEDYDTLVGACDVGLIFLDHRFTIPNFPSRLLSYMQAKLPVLACTDPNTDIGKGITEGGFGWWCESNDADQFAKTTDYIVGMGDKALRLMGEEAFEYLKTHYSAEISYNIIMDRVGRK